MSSSRSSGFWVLDDADDRRPMGCRWCPARNRRGEPGGGSKLDFRANLARLTPIVGQIFLVHAVYIVLVILWFSALCLLFAARLASGDPVARFLTGGLAAFWGLRAIIQLTVYDKKVRKDHRLQDVAFLAACALLTGIFLAAALH
jgi:hypothetical protein